MNASMDSIDTLTKTFAGARAELAERIQSLRDEQEAAKRRRIQGIKNSLGRFAAARDELRDAIDVNRELFDNPKTRTLHGVRIGLMKQRGKLEIPDQEACVAAMRRVLGDDVDAYLKVTVAPIRAALANLPAKDLKRIGATLSDDVDAIVIKPTDGELDKLIGALLSDPELEEATP